VSLYDDHGCLLWYCQNWERAVGSMDRWKEAMGKGWLEFVHPEDIDAVTLWIRAGDGARVRFRSVSPDGKGWQAVILQKHRVGLYWLAIGEHVPIPGAVFLPGPDCVMLGAVLLAGVDWLQAVWALSPMTGMRAQPP